MLDLEFNLLAPFYLLKNHFNTFEPLAKAKPWGLSKLVVPAGNGYTGYYLKQEYAAKEATPLARLIYAKSIFLLSLPGIALIALGYFTYLLLRATIIIAVLAVLPFLFVLLFVPWILYKIHPLFVWVGGFVLYRALVMWW